jgi:exopolysaccharide production protein ExoZ
MQRLGSIQALRFVAASLVVTTHLAYFTELLGRQPHAGWHHIGAIGVDIFFVISGFVISKIAFIERRAHPVEFAKSRFIRIVPMYYLSVLPWVLFWPTGVTPQILVATFLFFPAAGSAVVLPITVVGWTLCFELLFYLAATTILALRRVRSALVVSVAIWFAATVARYLMSKPPPLLEFIGNPMILEFLIGVGLARLRLRREVAGLAALIVGIGVFLRVGPSGGLDDGYATLDGSLALLRVVIYGLPAASVVFGFVQLERLFVGSLARAVAYLGDASYSLYLTHLPVVIAAAKLASSLQVAGPAFFIGTSVIVLAIGVAVHQVVERPLLRAGRLATQSAHGRGHLPHGARETVILAQ